MRRTRLDEDDLVVMLTPVLQEQGYIEEGHQILGFEYKTRKIKKGGDYYKDGVKDGEYPPEGVQVIQWIKVLIGPGKRKRKEEQDDDVEPAEESSGGDAGGEQSDG